MVEATAIIKAEKYEIVQKGAGIKDVLERNMGGESINAFDLKRVKVPAGGATVWMVPSITGDQPEKVITGVIVFQKLGRQYWSEGIEAGGGGSPPDCFSDNSITGHGEPGGSCADCEMSQWGSSPRGGRGQACSQTRQLFVIRPKDMMPIMINVPPSSLNAAKAYLFGLTSENVSYERVITSLGLIKARNRDGIEYAQIAFTCEGVIPVETADRFSKLRDSLAPKFSSVRGG